MQVALAQYDIVWEDPVANLAKVRSFVSRDVDLLVLPETCLTGFTMEPDSLAESMEGEHIRTLQLLADEHEVALMGSLVVREKDHIFNRMILFTPNDAMQYYDKRHLFTLGGEGKNYTAGANDGIFQLAIGDEVWKICARICYDLRFPAWCRNTTDYDLLVFVASWPEKRHHAWLNLVQARAIENQAYTIGVNRIGHDGNGLNYLGGSLVVDYNGEVIVSPNASPGLSKVVLSRENMLRYRTKLPFLGDRDHFVLD